MAPIRPKLRQNTFQTICNFRFFDAEIFFSAIFRCRTHVFRHFRLILEELDDFWRQNLIPWWILLQVQKLISKITQMIPKITQMISRASTQDNGLGRQGDPSLDVGFPPPCLIRLRPHFSKKILDNLRYSILDRFLWILTSMLEGFFGPKNDVFEKFLLPDFEL